MTLDELRALLEVIEAGSINQAASRLGVPRTTLNRRLAALEASFGTPLLTVSSEGASPTEAGARLAHGAEALLSQASQLDASVRFGLQNPTRPVRVVIPPGLAPMLITMGLQRFRDQVPDLKLAMSVQANPFEVGADGPADVIMSFGRPKLGDYRIFQLLRMSFALRASSTYLERHGTPTRIEELEQHALWVWKGALMSSSAGPSVLLRDGSTLPISPTVVLNDSHQLHLIAQCGLGLALVPSLPFALPLAGPEADEVDVLEGALGGNIGLWIAIPERNVEVAWTRRLIAELRKFGSQVEAIEDQAPDA